MLEIVVEVDGARVVLRLAGEVDLATMDRLAEALEQAVTRDGVGEVVVDLDGVTLLDSSGIRALLRGRATAIERGATVTVRNAHGLVLQALRITNVADLFGLG